MHTQNTQPFFFLFLQHPTSAPAPTAAAAATTTAATAAAAAAAQSLGEVRTQVQQAHQGSHAQVLEREKELHRGPYPC